MAIITPLTRSGLCALGATLALAATPALSQSPAPAELIISGGPIHTADPERPAAEAVAIAEGRIVRVGTIAEVEAHATASTRRIALNGAALYPGFTDGHAHLRGIGEREMTLKLEGAASITEAMQRLADWALEHPDGVIVGRGWIETHWPEGRFLERGDLDAAAPGRLVVLIRADGHALVASSAALQAAGIDGATDIPFGGDILKDSAGEPTGLLVDTAMALVSHLRPQESEAARVEAYRAGFSVYSRMGWTGIHNMSVPWDDVPLIEAMAERGEASLRVYNSIDPGGAQPLMIHGPRTAGHNRVITRAIKVYADGALGSRGAALFEPYADAPETSGLMLMTPAQAMGLYRAALRSGIQITTHAIGDRGNASVLDWYGEVFESTPRDQWASADPRWRIEHAQVLRPADFARFAAIPVIASMQPSHAIGDLHFAPARLGDQRLDGAYAWASLAEAGVRLAGGSDAPVERGDPLIEFYAAVARRDLSGHQGEDWRGHEALSRDQALALFTTGPAYASFREGELGMIREGFIADLSVFDIDLMSVPEAAIPEGRALLTLIDGEIVFSAEDSPVRVQAP